MPTRFPLVVLLVCPLFAAQQSGTVRSGGIAIPGAIITATQGDKKLVTTTDDAGRYAFSNLPAGVWTLQVDMFGFTTARREITVDDKPGAMDWTLELKPRVEPRPPWRTQPGSGRPRQISEAQSPSPGGFQNLNLSDAPNTQAMAELDGQPRPDAGSPENPAGATEAFLVNGSLSSGLDAPGQQGPFDGFRGDDPGRPFGDGFGADRFPVGDRGPGGEPRPGGEGGGPRAFGGPRGPGGFGGGGGFGLGRQRGEFSRRGGPGGNSANFGNRRFGARNQVRSSLFFTLRNSALDARPYSLTGQTVAKPSYEQNRFGLTSGGPLHIPKIVHSDKVFFFFNYFGGRARNAYSGVGTVPTPLERSGDFSQSLAQGPVSVFDPTTRAPFPNNQIPLSRLNPAALGLLAFIPLPNQPGAVQNYQFVTSVPSNYDSVGLRLNYNLSRKDRFDSNFNLRNNNSGSQQLFGFRDSLEGLGWSESLGWSHTLGPRMTNSLRWSFSRNRSETLPFFAYTSDVAAQLGIKGTSSDPINYGPPNLSFTNFGALTDASPVLRRDQTSSLSDGVQFTRNSHNFSVGGEFRRIQLNSRTDSNARGTFSFSGLSTSAFDANGQPLPNSGYDFADFLLGLPQSSSVRFGSANTYFRASVFSGYGQDDWRVSTKLTLLLGLRYEYFTPFTEKYGRIANLDIAPGFTGAAVVTPGQTGPYTGRFPAALIDPDKNNFSPRLGFAWRPVSKGRLLVRGGHSMFFVGSTYNQFPTRLASQPPFANTATLTTSLLQPLTLQNGFPTSPSTQITNTYAIDRGYRLAYVQSWNFSVQREFPHAIVLEAGYMGNKGTRLDIQRIPNRAAPGSPLTAEQRRRIGNAVGFTFDSADGDSIYHAGQFRLTRRFQRGLAIYGTYTYSKSIDNASSIGGGGATVAQNDQDLRAERGLSSFNRAHTLSLGYVLSSPAGKGKLLQDWTLSGGLTAMSGQPFTARVLGNQANTGGTGSVGSGRADATGLPLDAAGPGQFFNLAAFTVPQPGAFGNAGRNTVQGPAVFALNLSLSRSFRLGDDRRRVEFRVDSTNFTNHPGITGLNTVVNSSSYGLPLAAQGMRSVSATVRLRF